MSSQSRRGPRRFGSPNGRRTTGAFGKVRYYKPPVPEDEAYVEVVEEENAMARFNKKFHPKKT